jgi:hypothetical protein
MLFPDGSGQTPAEAGEEYAGSQTFAPALRCCLEQARIIEGGW